MICPVCRVDAEPAAVVGAVAICPCGSTNVIELDGTLRRAKYADVAALSDDQAQALREARRGKVRR